MFSFAVICFYLKYVNVYVYIYMYIDYLYMIYIIIIIRIFFNRGFFVNDGSSVLIHFDT